MEGPDKPWDMLCEMVVQQTTEFAKWLAILRDQKSKNIILRRINRIEVYDHLGETRSVGHGVSEMKVDCGPGYRLYFTRRDSAVIFLLLGGDKDSQQRDILKAQGIAAQLG